MAEECAFVSGVTDFMQVPNICEILYHLLSFFNCPELATNHLSPISNLTTVQLFYWCVITVEALEDNKAVIQKYLYIHSLNSSSVKVTGQVMMKQTQL